MTRLATWWRRAGGILAALVLAVMLSTPTVAAAACADEPAVATASIDQADESPAAGDQGDGAPCEDGCGLCAHCHCHHAGAHVPTAMTAAYGPAAGSARHVVAEAPAPTSELTFGLRRPPRA